MSVYRTIGPLVDFHFFYFYQIHTGSFDCDTAPLVALLNNGLLCVIIIVVVSVKTEKMAKCF